MNKAKESFVSSAIRRSTFLCGVALVAIAALPNNASAQDSTAAPDEAPNRVEAGEGVILVQARRQNERLQDVPVTITSVSGELMDKFVINQVSDSRP